MSDTIQRVVPVSGPEKHRQFVKEFGGKTAACEPILPNEFHTTDQVRAFLEHEHIGGWKWHGDVLSVAGLLALHSGDRGCFPGDFARVGGAPYLCIAGNGMLEADWTRLAGEAKSLFYDDTGTNIGASTIQAAIERLTAANRALSPALSASGTGVSLIQDSAAGKVKSLAAGANVIIDSADGTVTVSVADQSGEAIGINLVAQAAAPTPLPMAHWTFTRDFTDAHGVTEPASGGAYAFTDTRDGIPAIVVQPGTITAQNRTVWPKGNEPWSIALHAKMTATTVSTLLWWGTYANKSVVSVIANTDNKMWLQDNGGGLASAVNINDGVWHHICITYNGSLMSMYIDKVLEASKTITLTVGASTQLMLNYGFWNSGGGFSTPFSMSDLRIYRHCLTAAQVVEVSGINSTHQLSAADSGKVITCTAPVDLVLPADSVASLGDGFSTTFIPVFGSRIVPSAGVTCNGLPTINITKHFSRISIVKLAPNSWAVSSAPALR